MISRSEFSTPVSTGKLDKFLLFRSSISPLSLRKFLSPHLANGTSSITLTSIPLGHFRLTNALSIQGCDSRREVIFIRSELKIFESETVVIINSFTSFFSILLKVPKTEILLIGMSNLTKRYLALHIIAMPIMTIGRIFTPLKNQLSQSRKR